MHPWQPSECAEQSKQPPWIVCVCACVSRREKETAFVRPPR